MNDLALVGVWHGALTVDGASPLLLIFNFIYVNSMLKGYIDVPVQSVAKLGFSDISVLNNRVSFNITVLGAHFSGKFDSSLQSIDGLFQQKNANLPLLLDKVNNVSDYSINRPQTPVRPFSYIEENVLIRNTGANITLAGTLTYPNGTRPIALVVLAHGSGGHDRDETIFEHKPFLVIADHLTKNNIAVLRYDERGIAESTGNFMAASDVDFADDALTAIRYAQKHPRLSCVSKFGIIGQSKGGLTGTIASGLSKLVKFLVFLGGPMLPGEQILYLQTKLLLEASNYSANYIEKVLEINSAIYQIVKREPDAGKVTDKVISYFDSMIATATDEADRLLYTEFKTASLNNLVSTTSLWFRNFLEYDPAIVLSKSTLPMLALWGTHDLQVPADENYAALTRALQTAGNNQSQLQKLNGLNHLFQNSTRGTVDEYEKLEETFSVAALNIMSSWIQRISVQ